MTGVQPKLSLEGERVGTNKTRLTFVGLWGAYILKPPFAKYPNLPQNEDLTMHLAEIANIKTAEHSLIPLKSGELAYIAKRFDRQNGVKLFMEDMAQLTGVMTERKYRGSHEKIGKIIAKYSDFPGNDLVSFYELTLFSFLIGNADMHLKNFSLLRSVNNEISLSPAYDLVNTKIIIPDDPEDIALTVNGKKSNLKIKDFFRFAESLNIDKNTVVRIHNKFYSLKDKFFEMIGKSFLTEEEQEKYRKTILQQISHAR
jgi:serine/threonine-protein kinase HipA